MTQQTRPVSPPADVTVREASAMLGISERTIQQQITKGLIAARIDGARWLIPASEIERYRHDSLRPPRPYRNESVR